jgi:membrane protein implicated in regulation of membrane protease activity
MLSVYLASVGFGTVLIGISLLFGGSDRDFDKDVDLDHDAIDPDIELDAEAEADLEADHDGAVGDHEGPGVAEGGSEAIWIPFLSMRFWSFGTSTFGLAGTLMVLAGVAEWATAAMASLVGVAIGVTAARFFRALKRDTVTAVTSLKAYAGEEARVLLPIRPGGTGKIVVEAMAGRVEMPATSRDGKIIDRGATVIVASVRDGVADVSALHTLPDRRGENASRAKRANQGVKQGESGRGGNGRRTSAVHCATGE